MKHHRALGWRGMPRSARQKLRRLERAIQSRFIYRRGRFVYRPNVFADMFNWRFNSAMLVEEPEVKPTLYALMNNDNFEVLLKVSMTPDQAQRCNDALVQRGEFVYSWYPWEVERPEDVRIRLGYWRYAINSRLHKQDYWRRCFVPSRTRRSRVMLRWRVRASVMGYFL